jgi:hypothetical protein
LPFADLPDELLSVFLDADLPLEAPGFFVAPVFLAAEARLAVRLLADFARGKVSFRSVRFMRVMAAT